MGKVGLIKSNIISAATAGTLHQRLCTAPSGLVVHPNDGTELVKLARGVIEIEKFIPNRRIVINAQRWASPPHVSEHMEKSLKALAEKSGVTIALKTSAQPYAQEFEPLHKIAHQLSIGLLLASKHLAECEQALVARGNPTIMKFLEKRHGQIIDDEALHGCVMTEALPLIEKTQDDRTSLSAEERVFLLELAKDNVEHNFVLSIQIFEAFHDFAGLRRLLKFIHGQDLDEILILLNLEDHERAARLADLISPRRKADFNSITVFEGLRAYISKHSEAFAGRRGYSTVNAHQLYSAVCDLVTLSRSYDLVVAIAKGGLFSGAVADLLGLDVRVIEIHAHNRKNAVFKPVDEITPQDVAGKRVLLLDKDAVTGASIKEALRRLAPYKPSAIGVYFNYGPSNMIGVNPKTIPMLESLGVNVHHPLNTPAAPSLPVFHKLHERLNTPLGRLRKIERAFDEILNSAREDHPEAVDAIQKYLEEQKELSFALNHLLPGVEKVRHLIVHRLEDLLRRYQESLTHSSLVAFGRIANDAMRVIDNLVVSGKKSQVRQGLFFSPNEFLPGAEITRGLIRSRLLLLFEKHLDGHIFSQSDTFDHIASDIIGTLDDISEGKASPRFFDDSQREDFDKQKTRLSMSSNFLPDATEIHGKIVKHLEASVEIYKKGLASSVHNSLEHLVKIIGSSTPLHMGIVEELARARYRERGLKLAEARKVENRHLPHFYTASFRSAQKAVRGKYDVALIVGPEGFAYEPIFKDLGIPTVAVNIPEADFGGKRTLKAFDDLAQLKGKSVLVVEDDIQSGATLKKLLEELKPHRPRRLGLYLGSPTGYQMLDNVPSTFKRLYATESNPEKDERTFFRHLKKREVLFKSKISLSPFRIRGSKPLVKEQK